MMQHFLRSLGILLVLASVVLFLLLAACVPPVRPGAPAPEPNTGNYAETATYTPAPVWAEPSPSPLDYTDTPEPSATTTPTGWPSPTRIGAAQTNIAQYTAEPSLTGLWHIVRGGDTLYTLARFYGTTVEQLVEWNVGEYPSLRDGYEIVEGWALRVK